MYACTTKNCGGPRCVTYFGGVPRCVTKCDRERGSKLVQNSVTYFMDGPLPIYVATLSLHFVMWQCLTGHLSLIWCIGGGSILTGSLNYSRLGSAIVSWQRASSSCVFLAQRQLFCLWNFLWSLSGLSSQPDKQFT